MKNLFMYVLFLGSFLSTQAQIQPLSSYEYGQVLDVIYDPTNENTLYARTTNNHIVKSTDLGETWEVFYSVPQENWVVSVRGLQISADGESLIYNCQAPGADKNRIEILDIGTKTVLKQMFSPIGAVSETYIQSYSVSPENEDVALIHTTRMGGDWSILTEVFYTTNAGANWESVYFSPNHDDIHINNVAISPYNSQKLCLMRGNSPTHGEGGLYISEDGGQNWNEQLPGINFSALAFHPENENEMYLGTFYLSEGMEENLYKTTDGGENWNIIPIDWTSMSTNSIQSIVYNPSNYDNLIILEENEVVTTRDGFATWDNYVYEGNDYENEYYYGVSAAFNPFNSPQVIITANYFPFISNDGGATLERFKNPFAYATGRVSVYKNENQHIYYGVRNGVVHLDLQTQEENAYNLSNIGMNPPVTFSGYYADPNYEGRLFSTASTMMGGSTVMMSSDHGQTLNSIFNDFGLFLINNTSLASNPDIALLSFGERIIKFDFSDTENILSQEIMPPSMGFIYGVEFSGDENHFIITQQNKVYSTEDGGATWNEISNGLEILSTEENDMIFDLAQNPLNSQQWAIASSKGIFITNDGGENWTQSYDGGSMTSVKFSPDAEGKIVASSHFEDGSFYPEAHSIAIFTTDGGETWEEIGTDVLGYMRTASTEIVFQNENSAEVYFHVPDLGLISYRVDLTTLGNNEFNNQTSDVTLYPNPTTGILNFQSQSEIQNVAVFDLSGRKISEFNSSQVNISNLQKGIYIVKISTQDGKTENRKIVKQ